MNEKCLHLSVEAEGKAVQNRSYTPALDQMAQTQKE